MIKYIASIAAVTMALTGTAASALSLGDNITCTTVNSGQVSCSSSSATVSNAVEMFVGVGGQGIAFNFSQGLLTATGVNEPFGFGSTIVRFSDTTNPFTSATLQSQANISGLSAGDITLSNGVLSIALAGTNFARNSSFTVALGAGAVPEPATWAMMIAGFGLVGAAMRRRTTTKVVFA